MARDYNKSLASVLSPVRDFPHAHPTTARAFTLAEAVITILIVSIIAVAASLFAVHAHSRADSLRTTLATSADHNTFFDQFAADLRYATDVSFLSSSVITIACPDLQDPQDSSSCTYTYDPFEHRLDRSTSIFTPPTNTLDNVYGFSASPDTVADSPPYITGLKLTIQIGSSQPQTLHRFFECRNCPTFQ